jgi:hypothetical protein
MHVSHKASVKLREITNWVIQREKYIDIDLVLSHYGGMVGNGGNTEKITDSLNVMPTSVHVT